MKILRITGCLILCCSVAFSDVSLMGKWLFRTGNDSSWANPELNDSLWQGILVPSYWEAQGYKNYDGFGWYRYHFSLDSATCRIDSAVLILGRIDDVDETFLNGQKIGASGSFPPDYATGRDKIRKYIIPGRLFRRENVLAVRVFDSGKDGGIYRAPQKILIPEIKAAREIKKPKLNSSWFQIPFTNGISTAIYDVQNCAFNSFYPHVYRKFDEKTPTKQVISSARAILFRGEEEIPLKSLTQTDAGYIENTGIVKHEIVGENFTLTQYAFCPFSVDKPFWIFFIVLEGKDIGNLSLNFEVNTQNLQVNIGKWAYQANGTKWLTALVSFDSDKRADSYNFLTKFKNEHPGFSALFEEISWWKKWHQATVLPNNITASEKRLYYQSLCLIKMAQCRDEFPARGQIVSSLPPSNLNYTWVRDQAYSISALLKAGHSEEALSALQFIMNGRCGKYKRFNWQGNPTGVGQDYAVSVFRYFGNGVEESEQTDNGVIVEIEGLGLTLWNLRQYVEKTEDIKFLNYYWRKISNQIADVLKNAIDATGLIRADIGPWRRESTEKHYLYSSACAYNGLVSASLMARFLNDEKRVVEYEDAANALRMSIDKNLIDVDENSLKGNLEDKNPYIYMDAASVEALNWIYTSQDNITKGTLGAYDKYLAMKNPQRGYRRTPGGEWSDKQEWLFGDLRILAALQRNPNSSRTRDIRKWIVDQSLNNYGLIPQYYDENHAGYQGTVPRIGLGSGAYVLSFWSD